MSISSPAPSAPVKIQSSPAISRTNIILIVLLALQLAVCIYLFWPSNTATATGQPMLPGVTAESVTGLTITDDAKKSVTFIKQGDTWTVAGTDGYPAMGDKITQTLGKLLSMKTDRLVTQTSGSFDRLQVAENNFQRRIDITSTAASGVQTIYMGSSAGSGATFVRNAKEDPTYLTGAIASWELDTSPTTWMDVAYFTVPKQQLKEVTLKNAQGTFNMVPKAGTSDWTLADAKPEEPIAPANISTLLDRITTVNLASVVGKTDSPAYGLSAPLATLIITSTEAVTATASPTETAATTPTTPAKLKTTTLTVGALDSANSAYYLKSSDSPYYVLLASFTGDEFVKKARADFMEKATATPAARANSSQIPLAPVTAPAQEEQATPPPVQEQATPVATQLEGNTPPISTVSASGALSTTQAVTGTTALTTTKAVTGAATALPTVAAKGATTETTKVNSTVTPTATMTAKP